MKRIVGVLLFVLLCAFPVLAQQNTSIFFYIPVQEELDRFFNLYEYLSEYDHDLQKEVDVDMFRRLFELYQKNSILQSYFFESFLRSTKNKHVQDFAIKYIRDTNLNDPVAKSIVQYIRSTPIFRGGKIVRYSAGKGGFREEIDLFSLDEMIMFDKKLHVKVASNPWRSIQVGNDQSTLAFVCGGETNAYSMFFRKMQASLDRFVDNEVIGSVQARRHANWQVHQLPSEGTIKLAQADAVYIGYGSRTNEHGQLEGDVCLYLYAERYGTGYTIVHYMNFSKNNALHNLAGRVWSQLCQLVLLSRVD